MNTFTYVGKNTIDLEYIYNYTIRRNFFLKRYGCFTYTNEIAIRVVSITCFIKKNILHISDFISYNLHCVDFEYSIQKGLKWT